MSELAREVAKRLKTFRRLKGLSVKELSELMHKSSATIYKYESGDIPIDIETLEEIATALDVSPLHFFDPAKKQKGDSSRTYSSFLNGNRLYAYYYDGRINKLSKSLLTFGDGPDSETLSAAFYMHLKSFEEPEKARYLYSGKMYSFENVSYFILNNTTLASEILTLQVLHPYQNIPTSWGLFMGMSDYPATPMCTKMLFSKHPLTLAELDQFPLIFTKNELKKIKQDNSILLSVRSNEINNS